MQRVCRGVRGATTAPSNDTAAILSATRELLERIVAINGIRIEDVASVIFSTTSDLDAEFPARAARELGWRDTALLCTHEMRVPAGLPRCIRVLLHWNTERRPDEIRHVYLGDARRLRPDHATDDDGGDGDRVPDGTAQESRIHDAAIHGATEDAISRATVAEHGGVMRSATVASGEDTLLGTVAVIGLRLIGGSLAAALRTSGLAREVVGCDTDPATLERARSTGVIDRAETDAGAAVGAADTVVLAAPVGAILEILDRISPHLKPGALVLDVGSTKREVVERLNRLPAGVAAVGGHPMCGKETGGLEYAEAGLFQGAVFALCECERTDAHARATAEHIVAALGARPLWIDPVVHDDAVAAVSHLPYLLSVALVQTALGDGSQPAGDLAASGFRDTSRLAASDVRMILDVLLTNRDGVTNALDRAMAELAELRELLESGEEERLAVRLASAAEKRRAWAGQHKPAPSAALS